MTENDKQAYINEALGKGIDDIKGMIGDLVKKVDNFGSTISAHEERLKTSEDSMKAIHMKLWDIQTKFFWTVISAVGTLGTVVVYFIVNLAKN